MKYVMLGLGIIGVLVGAFIVFRATSGREITNTDFTIFAYGLLIMGISSILTFIASVIIKQRSKEPDSLFK